MPGTYYDTLTAANGCDSVISTQLNVLSERANTVSQVICAGDSILLGGNYQTTAGTYYDTLTAANGCDSVVTTNLSVLPKAGSTQSASICAGDSILLGGVYQTSGGTYYDTLTAANGCDSVVTTNLSVLPNASSSQSASICAGDSILLGGSYQTSGGTYYDTLTAANGCDSVVTTQLSINPIDTVGISRVICQGDSAFVGGGWQTAAGTYVDTFNNRFGCDSIRTTTLSVQQFISGTDSLELCPGDSAFLDGQWRFTAGLYTDTIFNAASCDTIKSTLLSYTQIDTGVTVIGDTALNAREPNADGYQWINCITGQALAGATQSTFAPDSNGLYAVAIQVDGCTDTSGCYAIDEIGRLERALRQLDYHPNPTKRFVKIELGRTVGPIKVTVVDGRGRTVAIHRYDENRVIRVDLGDRPQAEYFLRLSISGRHRVLKVVKQ